MTRIYYISNPYRGDEEGSWILEAFLAGTEVDL
jgi:hypothetical protein